MRFAWLMSACLTAALAQNGKDNEPFPPYRIVDNVYYVGASDITSYLITTPAGDFLINSGYESTAPIIRDNIQKLGFKLTHVKIILNGQAHFDHVAGTAAVQEFTGGKIYSSAPDAPVLESGGKKDPRFGSEKQYQYPPVKVAHVVKDGEKVTLGGVTLVAHMTPGHSIGCTTWTMQVTDEGKKRDVVFVGGTSINPGVHFVGKPLYPGIAEDFQRTFRVLRSLPCDFFLGAHGGYYGMIAKRERQQKGAKPNPFIDPQGYREFVDGSEKTFLDQLHKEQAEAKSAK